MSSENKFEEQLDGLLNLLSAGDADENEIENALSNIVTKVGIVQPKGGEEHLKHETDVDSNVELELELDMDEDDYDDPTSSKNSASIPSLKSKEGEIVDEKKLTAVDEEGEENIPSFDDLSDIPMGIIGGKMMVVFGDGKNPIPDAVAAALQGTRLSLQIVIRNARALYQRHLKERRDAMEYTGMKGRKGVYNPSVGIVDPETVFGVMLDGPRRSKLWTKECGFGMKELDRLYPEQMNEYRRFCEMRAASKDRKEDTNDERTKELGGGNSDDGIEAKEDQGHLQMRREKFDVRTDKMHQKWYLSYSDVRHQGSFLPNKATAEQREWNNNMKGRGRPKAASWEGRQATSVQFLYWIGFDPKSGLVPPDEKVTQALAFLGYDLMGRIVERAIELRVMRTTNREEYELGPGEQLIAADIKAALDDNEFKFIRATKYVEAKMKPNIYFGTGSEFSIENELFELSGSKISDYNINGKNEQKFLESEEKLFSGLVEPRPALEGVMDVLGGETSKRTKGQRERLKKNQTIASKRKSFEAQGVGKRKRGRPRKTPVSDHSLATNSELTQMKGEITKEANFSRPKRNSARSKSYNYDASSDSDVEGKDDFDSDDLSTGAYDVEESGEESDGQYLLDEEFDSFMKD